ncbi:MAG TPA: hypothetical protein DEH11_08315 [Actinobacteria bacterium]|nr:hypothetical protein [Actinomycetota bacterium]
MPRISAPRHAGQAAADHRDDRGEQLGDGSGLDRAAATASRPASIPALSARLSRPTYSDEWVRP